MLRKMNQAIRRMMMIAMGISKGRRASRTPLGDQVQPAQASAADHGNEPRKVKSTNLPKFMRATPAGKDMNVRIIGKRREKKAVASPYLANHLSAVSRWCLLMSMYLPYFSISGLPPAAPTQ